MMVDSTVALPHGVYKMSVFAIFFSIAGQFGDLLESSIKRHFGVKDSWGNLSLDMVVFWIVSIVCCLYFQSCTYLDSFNQKTEENTMLGILTFILVFGIIVVVHEFGHFYFAKKSGILVREFAIGMGPKIFAHIGKDGTAYTIRILPLGGYVRMAGWGDDTTEIKTGTPVSLTLTDDGKVKRINLSGKKLDQTALPMQVTQFDFEDKLFIKGLVLEEEKNICSGSRCNGCRIRWN